MDPQTKDLKSIRNFYDSVYHKASKPYVKTSIHFRRLTSRVKINKKQRVLDVGCGAGQWLFAASRLGAIPYGIDLSEKAISVCRSVMPEGTFYVQAAETLPFEDNMFDLVSCLGALEHFVDPQASLKEMVRVAKNNAKFLLLVPNADFPTLRLGLYSGTHQVVAKEEVLNLKGWTKLFQDCGLEIRNRWRDLHVLSWSWIASQGPLFIPLRAAQALALAIWPLMWQYQVYHLCAVRR
jgi:ubiquinone/menaquinone biosynthesis C-methylase UbiE